MNQHETQREPEAAAPRVSYAPQTFFKVLSLLEAFTVEQPELTLRQISQRSKTSTSTLYRYLRAMEDDGYVTRDPENGKYSVGLRLVELGGIALSRMEFRRYGQITLDKLSAKLQINSNIGLLYEGDLMHIAFAVHEDVGLRHAVIGRRSPAHCTAMGKVLLAAAGKARTHAIIDTYGWRPVTGFSINNYMRLDEELDAICRRGYAIDYREASENSGCVSFPVIARGNKVVAALSVSTTLSKLDQRKDALIESVMESGEKLSNELGFIGRYPLIRPQGYAELDDI